MDVNDGAQRATVNASEDIDRVRALLNTGDDPGESATQATAPSPAAGSAEPSAGDEDRKTDAAAAAGEATGDEHSADNDIEDVGDDQGDDEGDELPYFDLGELAERANVTPEDLYNQLQVPLEKGQDPVTLGELKDGYQAAARVAERESALDDRARAHEEQRDANERQALLDRRELRLLLETIKPETLPPAVLEELQTRERHRIDTNRTELHRTLPELKDPEKYRDFTTRAGKFLSQEYGFRPSELATIDDPRTFKMVSDHMRLKARLEEATKALSKAREKAGSAANGTRRSQQARPRANGAAAGKRTPAVQLEREQSAKAHGVINRAMRGT